MPIARAGALAVALLALAGCSSSHREPQGSGSGVPAALLAEARPIGHGPRFRPPVAGPIPPPCRHPLGRRYAVHVEVFAANRVVIVPAGIGVRRPAAESGGRIVDARCYGAIATLEPTGVVLVRPGARAPRLSELFRVWGQPLSRRRLVSFSAPRRHGVTVFVGGRRWPGSPRAVPLTAHAEIVLEVGPGVPPHRSYLFPPT
jgi:hypothetical protein